MMLAVVMVVGGAMVNGACRVEPAGLAELVVMVALAAMGDVVVRAPVGLRDATPPKPPRLAVAARVVMAAMAAMAVMVAMVLAVAMAVLVAMVAGVVMAVGAAMAAPAVWSGSRSGAIRGSWPWSRRR